MKFFIPLYLIILTLFFSACGGAGDASVVLPLQTDLEISKVDENVSKTDTNITLDAFNEFGVGFGGASSFKFHDNIYLSSSDLILNTISENSYYTNITNYNQSKFEDLSKKLVKSKYLVMWLTKDWQENWFDINELQRVVDSNKILVFNYWYFGDNLMYGLDNDLTDYYENVKRLKSFLDKIKGTKFIIMEPEFNKQNILDNPEIFIDAMSNAIDILKDSSTYISLCMMDTGSRGVNDKYDKCGYENCSLGDKYEWGLSKEIYDALLDKLDFISFEEMVGQFSRDPQNPGSWDKPNPISYSDDEIGIGYLHLRIDNFAKYLKELYNKPVFLPYIAIATASWNDDDADNVIDENEIDSSGWEDEAAYVYRNLDSNALFGYAIMELFDNPRHDFGGYQYFLDDEYHLGIVKSDTLENQVTGNIEFKGDILDSIFR